MRSSASATTSKLKQLVCEWGGAGAGAAVACEEELREKPIFFSDVSSVREYSSMLDGSECMSDNVYWQVAGPLRGGPEKGFFKVDSAKKEVLCVVIIQEERAAAQFGAERKGRVLTKEMNEREWLRASSTA